MICHEAIRVDFYTKCVLKLTQVLDVTLIVLRRCKNDLSVVTTLYNMVGIIRQYYSSNPWHSNLTPLRLSV
ncbi:hypothetical protein AYO28_18025 [Pseudomonas putida]|uniref:Uncharacterized protein n=1 Tax=Pseudomonas putida TaxID=303 RepID=A0A177SNQ1_PSEPU|nr:hypothetical protein AYO28_18025 [Pseudomonas putida]